MISFGNKLATGFAERGQLCLGLDFHESILLEQGYDFSATGILNYSQRILEAIADSIALVKLQVSFFEQFGSLGYQALEKVIAQFKAQGILVIADNKRGDIGSTMAGYNRAWLYPGSSLEVDAVTVSPYLGVDSLSETFLTAIQNGKGVFVLVANSNPEAIAFQSQGNPTLAKQVAESLSSNPVLTEANLTELSDFSAVGAVIGATVPMEKLQINDPGLFSNSEKLLPILAPGFGHQGAKTEDLSAIFGQLAHQVIVAESRSLLTVSLDKLGKVIKEKQQKISEAVHGITR